MMTESYTSSDLIGRLARRYPREKAWCMFAEIPIRTGRRRTDALVLNVSLGCGTLEGFEVKVARGDWLTELRQPEKATTGLLPYVHRWWIVAPRGVVRDGELPDGWGLLVPRGKNLVAVVQARPCVKPQPLDTYVCSVLIRRMWDEHQTERRAEVQALATELAGTLSGVQVQEIEEAATGKSRQTIDRLRHGLNEVQDVLGIEYDEGQGYWGEADFGGLSRWKLAPLIRWITDCASDEDQHAAAAILTQTVARMEAIERRVADDRQQIESLLRGPNEGGGS